MPNASGVRVVCLMACFLVACVASAAAAALAPFAAIPGAQAAIDPSGALSLAQARSALAFVSSDRLVLPGMATAFRPTVVWVRFDPPPAGTWYLEASPSVGHAELYYVPTGERAYVTVGFGMRVPVAQRAMPNALPTIALPHGAAHAPYYLRLALDDEARARSDIALIGPKALRASDRMMTALSSTALLFIGIFVSLAAANLFVFAFVRERSYALYSALMLNNALFAATYEHRAAWAFLWPNLSLPDQLVQGTTVLLEAFLLLAFARSFLNTKRIAPVADRIIMAVAIPLLVIAAFVIYVTPSAHFGSMAAPEFFVWTLVLLTVAVFALGVVALRTGSVAARFFVISNGLVSAVAALTGYSSVVAGAPHLYRDFVLLLTGQAVEGWLLFGALAYRLRRTILAHEHERQEREIVQASALTDAVTGIANRRAFDEALMREWGRCARIAAPLSLLMVDVDHFKRYNDTYGHVRGDACLRAIAGTIASCATRPSDLCARYGGEEFAMLLPETDAAGAAEIAQEIVRSIRALDIPHRTSQFGRVTVSVGVTTAHPAPDVTPTLVVAADERLYRAKSDGRDRYVS
ncbi:MAG: GGDEF domain-containing protein [bacterium]|nr:GGDEF domain-containing protein [bacterium]